MIIAIDGPAGSGKSTVAKQVARLLGFHYLDTGAMYRCVAWYALKAGVALDDVDGLARIACEKPIAFSHEQGNPIAVGVSIDDLDCTREIRTPEVDGAVSTVAAIPAVREALVAQQRAIAAGDDIVMEGRDIGTVVFPHAELNARDEADSTREVAPLAAADDAVELDTTGMSIDEVCAAIAHLAKEGDRRA